MRQKIDLLSRARGFLNPIQWEEPFGMVMIEAMSVGCPVITFARGSAPEIVAHGKSGFLVHDIGEMEHAIARIDELDRAVVRAYAEQHFSARAMAEKYVNIYMKVIAERVLAPTIYHNLCNDADIVNSSHACSRQNNRACSGSIFPCSQGKAGSGTNVLTC